MMLALADTNGAYMQTPSLEPLLDEADFLAELANLDHGLAATRRTPLPPVERQATDPYPGLPSAGAAPEREQHVADEEHDAAPSIVWRVTAAAMFVLMMGVGAAGAAVLFHDRVARLLAAW
jgi:hypothetical protein